MEPNSEQLAARIAATRDELSNNLDELGSRMKKAVNWRTQYEKHTVLFLSAAVLGGILVGSRSRRRGSQAIARSPVRVSRTLNPPDPSALRNVWSEVKAAIGSAVGSQVYSLLSGFNQKVRTGDRPRTNGDARFRLDPETTGWAGSPPSGVQRAAKTASPVA